MATCTAETLAIRDEAVAHLTNLGVPEHKIAKVLDRSRRTVSRSRERAKNLPPLVTKKRVRLAQKAIENTLQGRSTGDADNPKTLDVLKAAEIIMDRAEPKVSKHQSVVEHILHPVDLERYRPSAIQVQAIEDGTPKHFLLIGQESDTSEVIEIIEESD
jgi:hypothetical protein